MDRASNDVDNAVRIVSDPLGLVANWRPRKRCKSNGA